MAPTDVGFVIIPPQILARTDISLAAKAVWGKVYGLSGKHGYCYASDATLGKYLGLSDRQIRRHIVRLEELELLMRTGNGPARRMFLTHQPTRTPMSVSNQTRTKTSANPDGSVLPLGTETSAYNKRDITEQEQSLGPSRNGAYPQAFDDWWILYPKREGGNPKKAAFKAWKVRTTNGATPEELTEGLNRYAAYIRGTNKESTPYVLQAATFLGPNEHWKESYSTPSTKPDRTGQAEIAAMERASR